MPEKRDRTQSTPTEVQNIPLERQSVGRATRYADHVPEGGGYGLEAVRGPSDEHPRFRAAELERDAVPSLPDAGVPLVQLAGQVRLQEELRLAVEQDQLLAAYAEQPQRLRRREECDVLRSDGR